MYLSLNTTEWNHVANTMVPGDRGCWNGTKICADINGTYEYFTKHYIHGNKTHAFIKGYLFDPDLEIMPEKKNWWRSEKVLTENVNP